MNLFDLTGKVAIVTGGNGGIGLGMARRAGRRPGPRSPSSAATPRSREAAAARSSTRRRRGRSSSPADVCREADCRARSPPRSLERFGRIDILFNNAGINIRKPPQELTLEEWNTVLDVNLTSAFLLSKAVYPAMKRAGGGKIINIGSMTSIFGSSFAPAYAASKGGIVQLTKSLALAWAADHIQVNAILPGWFDTELTRAGPPGDPRPARARAGPDPHGRWAMPDDMAGTAVWLASPASDYVTGLAISVDGGYTAML